MESTQSNWTVHLNTGQVRDAQKARDFLAAPHVKVAYLLGEGHDWIDFALEHCELVVVRPFNPFHDNRQHPDETIHFHRSPKDPLDYMMTYHSKYRNNPRVRFIMTNEPEHIGDDPDRSIRDQLRWIAEDARSRAENGFGVAMGGWAVAKTIRIENGQFVDPGAWDPVLQVARDFPELVHLDFHEYTTAHLAQFYMKTTDKEFPESFLDWKNLYPKSNWSSIPQSGEGALTNWHIGRRHLLREYNRSLGYPEYYEGLGECPYDSMWENNWKDFIDLTFEPLFGKPKGIRTLRHYMAWLWFMYNHPEYSAPKTPSTVKIANALYSNDQWNKDIIDQLDWWKTENLMEGYNLYNAFFAYNTNAEWVDCCDISHPDFTGVINWMMNQQNVEETDTTPPLQEEFIRSSGNYTYIRNQPSKNSDPVGQIPGSGVYAIVHPIEGETPDADGLIWRYVEVNQVRGYVAWNFIVRGKPETPAPTEIRITLTSAQIEELRKQLKTP